MGSRCELRWRFAPLRVAENITVDSEILMLQPLLVSEANSFMTTQEIEVYSDATNRAIVRIPTRKFPGIVLQGDSLSILVNLAEGIYNAVKNSPDEDLVSDTRQLKGSLESLLIHYEDVLQEHGIPLPYSRVPRGMQ